MAVARNDEGTKECLMNVVLIDRLDELRELVARREALARELLYRMRLLALRERNNEKRT